MWTTTHYTNTDTYPNIYSESTSNSHTHSNTQSNSYYKPIANVITIPNSNAYIYSQPFSNSIPDTKPYSVTNADTNIAAYTFTDPD